LAALFLAFVLRVQEGDQTGEAETPRVPKEMIPPALALAPVNKLGRPIFSSSVGHLSLHRK